jgi:hypothetical protein
LARAAAVGLGLLAGGSELVNEDMAATTGPRFSDPKFIGGSMVLDDVTLYVPRKAYMLEFLAYQTHGRSYTPSLARANF